MIVFDLRCAPQGHVFEAWFGSSDDYRSQQQRGLVQCPLCGSLDIGKAAMAPRIGSVSEAPDTATPAAAVADPESVKAMLSAMAALQRRMLENSHYVGDRFANEARAIYLGESDARSIYGKATEAEKRSLLEDGIEVAPLPFPIVLPGEEN
jgi:hypothetical protein